jgi:tetratricopeptide (TPR) repeat protein
MKTIKDLFNEAFKLLIEVSPDTDTDYYTLINTDTAIRVTNPFSFSLRDPEKLDKVITLFNEILIINPNHKNVYEYLAIAVGRTNYEEAIKLVEKGFLIDPLDNHLYFRIGKLSFDYKLYEKAIIHFKKTDNFNKRPIVIRMLASAYFHCKDYENALYYFDLLIKLGNSTKTDYYYKGIIYFESENYHQAQYSLLKSYELGHNTLGLFRALTECFQKLDNFEEALKMADICIENHPDNWTSYFTKSKLIEGTVTELELFDFYEYAMNQNIDHTKLAPLFVHSCAKTASYERGLAIIERIAKTHPEDVNNIYNRAYLNFCSNKYDIALMDIEYLLEKLPENELIVNLKQKIIAILN